MCTGRIPEFFLITPMTPTGGVLWESNITHESGQAVADFTINLPQNVDVCSRPVRISAGNSAGMSAPGEAVEVGELKFSEIKCKKVETNMFSACSTVCSDDSTDSITTAASTTTVTTASSSRSDGNNQQGNSTTLLIGTSLN